MGGPLLLTIRRYLICGWHHRWLALAAAWAVCVAGTVAVMMIPSQYEAGARIYVDADAVLTPLLRGLAIESASLSDVEVLQRTLLSRPNLDKLISSTALRDAAPTQSDRERIARGLAQQIKVIPQTRNLFTVEYRSTDRDLAYSVVKTIITIFLDTAAQNRRADMENAQRFLDQQIDSYERQLREAERRRADFRAKYVTILAPDGGGLRLEAARESLHNLEGNLRDAENRRDMLRHELQTTPPTLADTDPGAPASPARARLIEAERNLQELLLRFTDKHPDVIAARKRLEALRSGAIVGGAPDAPAARARAAVSNPVYQEVKLRLLDAEAAVATLQRQVDDAQRERDRLEEVARANPMLEAQSQGMDRDYNVLRKNYEELLSRRESTRIAAAADTDGDKLKLQVIDPPEVPRVPVAPNRRLLLGGVLVVGLGAGIGLAWLLVQLDSSFYTVEDLRGIGLPVLGGVSMLRAPPRRRVAGHLGFALGLLLLFATFGGLTFNDWLLRLI